MWEGTHESAENKLQLVYRKDRNPYIGLTENGKLVMCAVISKFEADLVVLLVLLRVVLLAPAALEPVVLLVASVSLRVVLLAPAALETAVLLVAGWVD